MSPIESILELRDKILTLAVRHPQPCSLLARKLAGSESGLYRFAVLVELIGFEYAKTVFDGIPTAKWERIHQLFFEHLQELRSHPPSDILAQLHAEFVGATLSWDPQRQSEGAFDFLKPLNQKMIHLLLRSEKATSIALISLEWGEEDVAHALNALPQPLRRDSVLAISRLRRIPEEILVAQGQAFASHLRLKLKMVKGLSAPPASVSVASVSVASAPAPSTPVPIVQPQVQVDDVRVRQSIERIATLSSFLCTEQVKVENAVLDLLSVKSPESISVSTSVTPEVLEDVNPAIAAVLT